MTTSPPLSSDDEFQEESKSTLRKLIQEQSHLQNGHDEEQQQFNGLSKDLKLTRLNNLIEKSQIYSKIIADNILQSSLQMQQQQQQQEQQPTPEETPKRKKRKTASSKKQNAQKDIVSMLSTNISDSTKSTREAIEKSQSSSNHSIQQPKLLSGATLKDYQLDGLEWLVTLYQNGLNGILADEMGLGKTIQCIAFLSFLIEKGIKGPFLIVVPLSTLSNWENEIRRFAPKVKVFKYGGNKVERAKINLRNKKDVNIILTSYEISIRDFSKLSNINWNYLIVDEGHRLKNNECLLIKFLKKLNVSNRLLLTGTPLQNNLNELWSLLNFILPDIFHDLELFQQWFNFDELTNFADNELEEDEETKRLIKINIQETLIKNLHTILKPFILRRLKRDVIWDLPPKKEYLIHIPLTPMQRKLYYDAINNKLAKGLIEVHLKEFIKFYHWDLFKHDLNKIDEFLENGGVVNKPNGSNKRSTRSSYKEAESDDEFTATESETDVSTISTEFNYEETLSRIKSIRNKSQQQTMILESVYHYVCKNVRHLSLQNPMAQLRNICNSPYIYYDPTYLPSQELPQNHSDEKFMRSLVANSAKFQFLNQIIPPLLSNNHKVLIFSQFTKLLDLLHDYFTNQDIAVCRLDGSTPQSERQDQINQFNKSKSEEKVFLLSTRAGGLGINLVGADTVILFDSDWNPQMDLQAIDRVHRIGQVNPVKIYRFITRGSIEEILITKSSNKRFLERLVLQMGEFKFNKLKKLIGVDNEGEDNNEELNVTELIEVTKHTFHPGDSDDDADMDDLDKQFDVFSKGKEEKELLTTEEFDELLDRSDECYLSTDDSQFKNISVFETVNNMDK
ncbi:IRC5 [[Candida] subhashii]|uniref:IRC5 n=1 Tax=[Candida] subhashii TaxID=561895 RepID=A0A8J5QNG3_9ASCO|nr:IRC5 [[Candida] subhashii]KAG7666267.1 IRC5 [[Candida] subhashii]